MTPEEMTSRVLCALELGNVVVTKIEPASNGEALIHVRLSPALEKALMDDLDLGKI